MSQSAATGSRAVDVPSTPLTALGDLALGSASRVLSQAALGTEKKRKDHLALVDGGAAPLDIAQQYFAQVFGWTTDDVVAVTSWDQFGKELGKWSSIGELAVYAHSTFKALAVDGVQLTSAQFAARFAPIAPPIGALSFEGCVLGHDLAGLHTIATQMKIPEVRAWTFWHYMYWWRLKPTGNVQLALPQFSPFAATASPYLPKTQRGDLTYSVAEQEELFKKSAMHLIGEYFVEFEATAEGRHFDADVMAGVLNPAVQRPRATAEVRLIDSASAQGVLEGMLNTSRPPLARAIMTPWV